MSTRVASFLGPRVHLHSGRCGSAGGALVTGLVLALGCSSGVGGDGTGAPAGHGAGTAGSTGVAGTMGAAGTIGTAGVAGSAGTTGSGGTGEAGSAGTVGSSPGTGGRGGSSGGQVGTAGSTGGGGQGAAGSGAGATGTGGGSTEAGGGAVMSPGCGQTPTLKNSPTANPLNYNTVTSGGTSRKFVIRWPTNYDNSHPYRLILGFHGATGNASEVAGSQGYFGLAALSGGSTIFVAAEAVGGLWSAAPDLLYVDQVVKAVEADLCIDTTRVELEGFSQGAAMVWTLACGRPGKYRAAIGHSGGGVANPTTCQAIPYMGSLGLQENSGGQNTQTDQFAKFNGCTIATLPKAPTGGHVCTDYTGCPPGYPVRWCSYDGGHTPQPTDMGQSKSWMPMEAWTFFSRF